MYKIIKSNNFVLDKRILNFQPGPSDEALRQILTGRLPDPNASDIIFTLEVMNLLGNLTYEDLDQIYTIHQSLERGLAGQAVSQTMIQPLLEAVLLAFGIQVRPVLLLTEEADRGPEGSSHRGLEVWSNQAGKWFFMDPYFSVYFKDQDQFLSVYEIYQHIHKASFDVEMIFIDEVNTSQLGTSLEGFKHEYKEFIEAYMGLMLLETQGQGLLLQGGYDLLYLEGQALVSHQVSVQPANIYLPLNQAAMILDKHGSHYSIQGDHNMPGFDHFLYRLEGKDYRLLEGNTLDIALDQEEISIGLIPVNRQGLRGIECQMTMVKMI